MGIKWGKSDNYYKITSNDLWFSYIKQKWNTVDYMITQFEIAMKRCEG